MQRERASRLRPRMSGSKLPQTSRPDPIEQLGYAGRSDDRLWTRRQAGYRSATVTSPPRPSESNLMRFPVQEQ